MTDDAALERDLQPATALGAPDAAEPPVDDAAQAARIQRYWELVRGRAGLGRASVVTGPGWATSVPPQAWAFGDSPELADELLELVLIGTKTATAAAVWEYEAEGEPLPVPGTLSIVLDGAGVPRALLRTTEVVTVPFAEVTAEQAYLEGEGDRSLEEWRAGHERYWRRTLPSIGHEFAPDMPVVWERFEVLHPRL
jgi:uncharacterized protein YhfF